MSYYGQKMRKSVKKWMIWHNARCKIGTNSLTMRCMTTDAASNLAHKSLLPTEILCFRPNLAGLSVCPEMHLYFWQITGLSCDPWHRLLVITRYSLLSMLKAIFLLFSWAANSWQIALQSFNLILFSYLFWQEIQNIKAQNLSTFVSACSCLGKIHLSVNLPLVMRLLCQCQWPQHKIQ